MWLNYVNNCKIVNLNHKQNEKTETTKNKETKRKEQNDTERICYKL